MIIWFSGHGTIYGYTGYWLPVDAKNEGRATFVSNDDIRNELDPINFFHLLVIVDACFSGSIFVSQRDYREGLEARRSRWGISSTPYDDLAADGTPGENSPFAEHFLAVLRDNDGPMGTSNLYAMVKEGMRRSNPEQLPIFSQLDLKGHDQGEFVFYLKGEDVLYDERDHKSYGITEVNGLFWMTQNLDYFVDKESSVHYINDPRLGKIFGRLYTWDAANEACPKGWRLPTDKEWEEMLLSKRGFAKYRNTSLERIEMGKIQEVESELVKLGNEPKEAYQQLIHSEGGLTFYLGGLNNPDNEFSPIAGFDYLGSSGLYWTSTNFTIDEDVYYKDDFFTVITLIGIVN